MVSIGYIAAFDGSRTYLVVHDGQTAGRFGNNLDALRFAADLCDSLGFPGKYRGV